MENVQNLKIKICICYIRENLMFHILFIKGCDEFYLSVIHPFMLEVPLFNIINYITNLENNTLLYFLK